MGSPQRRIPNDTVCLKEIETACYLFTQTFMRINDRENMENQVIPLTCREREILLWLAEGKTKREVADQLNIGFSTVKRHCEQIAIKLHTQNTVASVAKALQLKLISPQ